MVGKVYDGRLATPMVAERTTYTRDARCNRTGRRVRSRRRNRFGKRQGDRNLRGPFDLQANQGSFFESELLTPDAPNTGDGGN